MKTYKIESTKRGTYLIITAEDAEEALDYFWKHYDDDRIMKNMEWPEYKALFGDVKVTHRMTAEEIQNQPGYKAANITYQTIERGEIIPEYNRNKELFLKGQNIFKTTKNVSLLKDSDLYTIFANVLAIQKRANEMGLLIIPLKFEEIEPAVLRGFKVWQPGAWLKNMLPLGVLPPVAGWQDCKVFFASGDKFFEISILGGKKQIVDINDVLPRYKRKGVKSESAQERILLDVLNGYNIFRDIPPGNTKRRDNERQKINKRVDRLNATLNKYFGLNGEAIRRNGRPFFTLKIISRPELAKLGLMAKR